MPPQVGKTRLRRTWTTARVYTGLAKSIDAMAIRLQRLQDEGWTIFSIGYDGQGDPMTIVAWKMERVLVSPPAPPEDDVEGAGV